MPMELEASLAMAELEIATRLGHVLSALWAFELTSGIDQVLPHIR